MVKEIVFHLGNRKTGSTSIQDALAQKAVHSPETSIFYPARANNLTLAKTLSPYHSIKKRQERFQMLARRIDRSDADIAVVSAEFFEEVDPQVLQEVIDQYLPQYRDNIRLIAYVRPHAERVLSNFAEQTKLGQFFGPLERFHQQIAKQKTLFYTPKFEAWRRVFGDAFELRPFIRDRLHNGDVVDDFIDYVLQGAHYTLQSLIRSNSSLSVEYLSMVREFQRILHENGAPTKLKIALGKYLGRQLATYPVETHRKLRLHKRAAQNIIETYQQDAAALDAEFFPQDHPMEAALLASLDKAIDKPLSLVPADNMTRWHAQMVQVWAGLFSIISDDMTDTIRSKLNSTLVKSLQQNAPDSVSDKTHIQAEDTPSPATSDTKEFDL